MAINQRRNLRRRFRRFFDTFRTPACNETVRCSPVSRTLFVSLTIIVTGGALWTVFPQLPNNVLSSNRTLTGANLLTAVFPQGWAFFTHYSPTEELYHVYRTAAPTSLTDRLPYAEPKNLFGLDRTPKKQTQELDRLVQQIHDGQWQPCASDDQCRNSPIRPIVIQNHALTPTYCGAVTVIGYTMVPWASRGLVSGSTIDSRAVRLDIQCIQD
jgi:antimicrobial peptide system SdpA family protein